MLVCRLDGEVSASNLANQRGHASFTCKWEPEGRRPLCGWQRRCSAAESRTDGRTPAVEMPSRLTNRGGVPAAEGSSGMIRQDGDPLWVYDHAV
jgi:hypothetical protein